MGAYPALCLNTFNVIVLRTFFKTTIPDSVVESAKYRRRFRVEAVFQDRYPHGYAGTGDHRTFPYIGLLE